MTANRETLATLVLEDTALTFRRLKELAERALAQVDDAEFFRTIDRESNSIAIIVQHIGGNLRSRWTEFMTTDGEKSWRDRDGEFIIAADTTRADVMAEWDAGWRALTNELADLAPDDLTALVTVRGESMPAIAAMHRSLAHVAQHVGQIVLLAKHHRVEDWKTLSIPRGESRTWKPAPPSRSR